MSRKTLGLVISMIIMLTSLRAAADPPMYLRMRNPAEVCTLPNRDRCLELLPGRYVEESHWTEAERETKRLQDVETRLSAENASLRKSAEGWQPGWRTLAITFAVGLAGGIVVYRYLDR